MLNQLRNFLRSAPAKCNNHISEVGAVKGWNFIQVGGQGAQEGMPIFHLKLYPTLLHPMVDPFKIKL